MSSFIKSGVRDWLPLLRDAEFSNESSNVETTPESVDLKSVAILQKLSYDRQLPDKLLF